MKKIHLKKTTKAKKTDLESSDIKGIQQLIFDNPKNINKFNIIIEQYINELQLLKKKTIVEYYAVIEEIFKYFLIDNSQSISLDLANFLWEKIDLLMKVYIDVLEEAVESEKKEMVKCMIEYLFNAIQKFHSRGGKFDNAFQSLINLLVLNEEVVDPSAIQMLIGKFSSNETCFHFLLENLSQAIALKKETSQISLYNLYNFIIITPQVEENTENKKIIQDILIYLINHQTIPKDLLKNFLLNLNKKLLENVSNPLIFSDYLINIYEKSQNDFDFDIVILSLSGLFILITKYQLDYENYYKILYQSLCIKKNFQTIFISKYANRLYKILELSLKSATVPLVVVYSFIKRIARLCLTASDHLIAINLALIQNLMKSHPKALSMIMGKKRSKKKGSAGDSQFNWEVFGKKIAKEETVDEDGVCAIDDDEKIETLQTTISARYDQFKEEELDPYLTNAQFSSLWELYSLQCHYSVKIRTMARNFSKNFLSKQYNLPSISKLTPRDMLYDIQNTNAHFYVA